MANSGQSVKNDLKGRYILVYTSILKDYPSSYVLFTGFRGTRRDVPPVVETQTRHEEDEGDPNHCPEDDADLMRPDAEEMERGNYQFLGIRFQAS